MPAADAFISTEGGTPMWRGGWHDGPIAGWDHWGMGVWPWPGFLWVLLLILIVVGVLLLVRDRRREPEGEWRHDPARDAALAELGRRYARGQIDREEFLRRKNDLA